MNLTYVLTSDPFKNGSVKFYEIFRVYVILYQEFIRENKILKFLAEIA